MFFAKKRFCSDNVTILFGIGLFVRIFEYGADSESENNLLKAVPSEGVTAFLTTQFFIHPKTLMFGIVKFDRMALFC